MKKIIALFMTALMVVSLAACAGSENTAETQPVTTTVAEETTTAAPETETTLGETEAPVEVVELKRGTINGQVYTNELLGITYTAPDDMVYCPDQELADIFCLPHDVYERTEITKIVNVYDYAYDMKSVTVGGGNYVTVDYALNSKGTTPQEYIDSSEEIYIDLDYTIVGRDEKTLGNFTYKTLEFVKSDEDDSFTRKIYVADYGYYFITIVISVDGASYTLNDLENCIS